MKLTQIKGIWCVVHKDEVIQLTDEQAKGLQGKNDAQLRGEIFRMFPKKSREYKLLKKWYGACK